MINKYYGVENVTEGVKDGLDVKVFGFKQFEILKAYPNPSNNSADVIYSELNISNALLINVLRTIVIPRKSASRLEEVEKQFLICVRRGWKMNIGELIITHMKKLIINLEKMPRKQKYLYYPSLITGLCKEMNIPISKRDIMAIESEAMGSILMRKVKKSRGGNDTPEEGIPAVRRPKKTQVEGVSPQVGGDSSSAQPAAESNSITEGNVQFILDAINNSTASLRTEIQETKVELKKQMQEQVQVMCDKWKEEFLATIEDPIAFAEEWKRNKDLRVKKSYEGFSRFSTMETPPRTTTVNADKRKTVSPSVVHSIHDLIDDESAEVPTAGCTRGDFGDKSLSPACHGEFEDRNEVAKTPDTNCYEDQVMQDRVQQIHYSEDQDKVDETSEMNMSAEHNKEMELSPQQEFQIVVYQPPVHTQFRWTGLQHQPAQQKQIVRPQKEVVPSPVQHLERQSMKRIRGPVKIGDADDMTVEEGEEVPNPTNVNVKFHDDVQDAKKKRKLMKSVAKKKSTRSAAKEPPVTRFPPVHQYTRKKKLIKQKQ